MSLEPAPVSPAAQRLSTGRWTVFSFAYWVLFMAVLTPGNIANGLAVGMQPNWPREILRLAGAGVLGASATPLLLALVHRFPAIGGMRWRNLLIQGLGVAGLAPGLVLVSCFLAVWAFARRLAPTPAEVAGQLLANTGLVMFCLSLLLVFLQILPWLAAARRAADEGWAERLTIGERGRLRVIDVKTVDWIETQGNYQALHSGNDVHLFRGTSKGLEAKLDPGRFVRIHRRFIVAADRVRQVEPLANGDALVQIASGAQLRQSRHYRDSLRAHLLRRAAG